MLLNISSSFTKLKNKNLIPCPLFFQLAGNCPFKANLKVDKLILNNKSCTINDLEMLPEPLKPNNVATQTKNNITAFYTKSSPLSNHYPCSFPVSGKKIQLRRAISHASETSSSSRYRESKTDNDENKQSQTENSWGEYT